ncbi:MAG: cytochrome c [Candidatus Acidiferrum sp.]
MATATKKIGMLGVAIALVAGSSMLSSPAKADVASAEATFKAKCAACHGADGKGKEMMKTRDLGSPDVQKQTDADLTTIITKGKGKMPAYGTLTPDQVKDLVTYVRSLKK